MNRAKRSEAIVLLNRLNENYEVQIKESTDKLFIKKMNDTIALNLKRIKILENSSCDFTNVKRVEDLDNLKLKPREY